MGLWTALKGLIGGHRVPLHEESETSAKTAPTFIISYSLTQQNDWFFANHEVIAGYHFVATLQLRTPLKVLEKHGEIHPGPPSMLPRYGEDRDGIWVPKTKPWAEIAGLTVPEVDHNSPEFTRHFHERLRTKGFSEEQIATIRPNQIASDIGPISEDQGDYLHFLKDFRRIVEAEDSVDEKVAKLNSLFRSSATYEAFAKKHGSDLATAWFAQALCEIPGIGLKIANVLFTAGYRTLDELKYTSDQDLQKLPGIGSGTVRRIRAYFAQQRT